MALCGMAHDYIVAAWGTKFSIWDLWALLLSCLHACSDGKLLVALDEGQGGWMLRR